MDVQQQRVEFVTAAKQSPQPFRALCQEFGISRPTGCADMSGGRGGQGQGN